LLSELGDNVRQGNCEAISLYKRFPHKLDDWDALLGSKKPRQVSTHGSH
jgi:hypothetical protein